MEKVLNFCRVLRLQEPLAPKIPHPLPSFLELKMTARAWAKIEYRWQPLKVLVFQKFPFPKFARFWDFGAGVGKKWWKWWVGGWWVSGPPPSSLKNLKWWEVVGKIFRPNFFCEIFQKKISSLSKMTLPLLRVPSVG